MATSRPNAAAHPRRPPRLLPLVLLLLLCSSSTLPRLAPAVVHAAASPTTSLNSALGIPQTASPSEVRKAYRKMALRHHPDKVPESDRPDAERRFKEIARAY